jgi:AraC-like DNA-binding protein
VLLTTFQKRFDNTLHLWYVETTVPSIHLISTESVQMLDRVLLYRDTLRKLFGGLDSRINTKSVFSAVFEEATIGDVGLCRYSASAHQVERTDTHAHNDKMGLMKVAIQIKGSSCLQQCGHRVTLSPGDWSIYDTAKPYTITMLNDVQFLFLMLPRERILSNRYNLSDLTLRRLSGSSGVAKMAAQFISATFDEIERVDSQSESDIADTMLHLLRLALIDLSDDEAIGSQRQVLLDRIKSCILNNLRDPQLSIEHIAATLNCSKRYLHKVFEVEGVSISDYIWHLRLDHCREDLLNPACHGKSITDIAFSWGFNSSAHFSTVFKNRFKLSPRFCRETAQPSVPISLRPF